MVNLRFGVWNIEWMNDLFSSDCLAFKPAEQIIRGPKKKNTVADRIEDIAGVINSLSLDILVIVEGPNQTEELQLFFDDDRIYGNWKCAVQSSGAQSIGIAVCTETGKFTDQPISFFDTKNDTNLTITQATEPFLLDTDRDGLLEQHKFERKPLYVDIETTCGNHFRILGLHLKSKGIFDALEWSAWWSKAEGNRKKILAQCNRLREEFIIPYLQDDATKEIPLIICGDINDGPGMDAAEMAIGQSGIERLMGVTWKPEFTLGNVLFDALPVKKQKKLDFSNIHTTSFRDPLFDNVYRKVWIDHILYTRNNDNWAKNGAVAHTFDEEKIYYKYPASSDHFPVICDLELGEE